ncbi:hypothetical protein [Legionella sp.]|uniref:hypothetical protein n=1 Tax=Legionella sp. TaxID=459 RepID=UPI003D0D23C9
MHSIENKIQLDREQPNNKMRLELSRKIISLNVYADQLRNEIENQSQFDVWLTGEGLTVDKSNQPKSYRGFDRGIRLILLLAT